MSKKEKMVVYIEGVVFTLEIIGFICKYHQLRLMLLDILSYFFRLEVTLMRPTFNGWE